MGLNKNSSIADALANLYRAAFYIAKNQKREGVLFFKKAKNALGKKITVNPEQTKDNLLLAEKILDEYKRLLRS